MKNVIMVLAISILSSGLTLGIYKFCIEKPVSPVRDVIIKEASYAKQVNNPNYYPDITNVSSFKDAADLVRPTVVHIHSNTGGRYERLFGGESSGSGVIVSEDGYIVTNNHVISGAEEVTVTLNNKRTYEAKIIGTDKTTDLAVIKIKKRDLKEAKLPMLQFGNSDDVFVGEWVLAVGNPFNLTSTVTAGIVSAKGRNIDILDGAYDIESFIQTDAVVNPGNSGGALVDTDGNLIGINTAIITRSGRYEGYSFAVPANLVKKVMQDLIEFGEVQRGFLGVTIKDISDEIADENDLESMNGVYIQGVGEESAAEEAGLEQGDVIVRVNGIDVKSSPELQEQVGLFRPGEKIAVIFLRAGKLKSTEVTLKNGSNTISLGEKRNATQLASKSTLLSELGIEAKTLADKELKSTNGVIITKIEKDGIIEHTNMEREFIVTAVNNTKIANLDEFMEAILEAEGEVVLDGFYKKYPGEYSYVFDKD
ncbi:S1C family serine protease [Aureispira anguillae]|uniref:Trypsin-like peptidase domain-containing protein n=1 Tax=Aureispira anguillae TaxID=2864201 RepID=A0A915YH47_9BACT|nr:trypsin-like peptidase domain-containing protein [Aureispira anguillae]BDS12919.1 trypsin-like peptidase domain-containing protein [Aureispira anguillae]